MVAPQTLAQLARRLRRAAADAVPATSAPAPRAGSYRLVLDPALAKGLAHEAIGHLCESDVDGSVLMRDGRLRIGEQFARRTVSIVDGPLPGDYARQPFSANGLPRQTVALIEGGVLASGLGDPFTTSETGISTRSSCRTGTFRDRPTPRMTNIRIELADAIHLPIDPDLLTPEDVAAALRRAGLLEQTRPTLYLRGYRGGQAHPRRGDFIFAADAAFDLSDGGAPRGTVSFSGLAERALASIVAGFGPLCTEAAGICQKNGSSVSSSGGSHALLVLDPDPDLIVTAAS
jgi:TldD protein